MAHPMPESPTRDNPAPEGDAPVIPHNLGLYRLTGFSGRKAQLLTLHHWLTDAGGQTALAISGNQGNGKSTLATAAAWNNIHHFSDGVIWVGAAGPDRFRLYDIVRTLDTVLGTTLTRVSEERWGIGILEQLYRRRRLLILDELSGATPDEIRTLVDIISHLHETQGHSRILLIDRDIHPQIANLVGERHLHLAGLSLEESAEFVGKRAPELVRGIALRELEALHSQTGGRPLSMRLVLGLLLDLGNWLEVERFLQELPRYGGTLRVSALAAYAVENFAAFWPQAGPLLDRLVRAAGGATFTALRELFWQGLGTDEELEQTRQALVERALVEEDHFRQRIVVQPVVRRYLAQGAVMLGEEWDRAHATYYLRFAQRYQELPLHRWTEIDAEWGNIHLGADWFTDRVERIWDRSPIGMVRDQLEEKGILEIPLEGPHIKDDLRLAREYAKALAHYAFWRHPPGILRWLAAGGVAAYALGDVGAYGWLLNNIGRQLFFKGEVAAATDWLYRAARIFDERDMLAELAYVHTDLGTSYRVLDEPRRALEHFWAAFETVAQLGDIHSLATTYINLGSAHFSLRSYEKALTEHRKALRIALRLHHGPLIAGAYNNMGLALEGMERLEQAQIAYEAALRTFQQLDDLTGISTCYNNLGSVCYARQDYEQALSWYEKDLALSERRGAWMDMAATLHNLGHVALEMKNLAQAEEYFRRSRDLYAAFHLAEYVREEEEMIEYVRSLLKNPEKA